MEVWQYLPNPWRQALAELPLDRSTTLEEIRFRVNRPAQIYGTGWNQPLLLYERLLETNSVELDRIVGVLVEHSLYARADELRHGYITLPEGHRVGIAGRAVMLHGRVDTVRQISSLNVRVAHQVLGAGHRLIEQQGFAGEKWSWLLVSPPRAGKTTLLRDMVRYFGDRQRRVVVVDERSEIAGLAGAGGRGFDLGCHTDVLDGWPKPDGIEAALRTLGPDIIAVDELGDENDLNAVAQARFSGVQVLATVHARTSEDLQRRTHLEKALLDGTFDALVFLTATPVPGTVAQVLTNLGEKRASMGMSR